MIHKKNVFIMFLTILCVMSFFVFQGCGKKGPPVPPVTHGEKISSPFNLRYAVAEEDIELTWNHTVDRKEAYIKPIGFEIFLAKLSFESCQGCPFKFQKIGFVTAPSMKFVFGIEKGYKYYFRVQAKGKDNLVSEFSETVLFEYK
ncbi:MAG: hypothetical protein A3J80_04000 [Desulfobacula sp. RIFOXYB2_FULL_45_6]|nr:MAG: hypothetical protein A3J80_04000 [Desulfobacula sp. RIFOXYB2_FULL_45_6]